MTVHYEVSFPSPADHYLHVKMTIGEYDREELRVGLPVWTPGSYLVREYAQHVETFSVKNISGKPLVFTKVDKNSWHIETGRSRTVVINYSIYCFDATVRTNFVDADHATVIGANTFLYIKDRLDLPAVIEFRPWKDWPDIATALPQHGNSKWVRRAQDYHMLVDSPVEIGSLSFYEFKAAGIPHTLAMFGDNNADMETLIDDLQRICAEHTGIFGDNPCPEYLFILLNTDNRYNGLEHKFSSLNQLPRLEFFDRDRYQRSMGLLSHEYFHLWNVTRIRPVELSTYDYDREVYTRQLWVAEGVTSYYDDYVLYRAGVYEKEEYLKKVAKVLSDVVNAPGDTVQSLTESSHDAWIKYYRKNENSNNNQVSYYDKGAMIVMALNFLIMHESGAERTFDDVLRELWQAYKNDSTKGYTEDEFRAAVENAAGISLEDFFKRHVYGKEPLDYKKYFGYAGLGLVDDNAESRDVQLGLTARWDEGKLIVSKLDRNYGAYKGGLNVNDEIIAIDGYRVNKTWEKIYSGKVPGDTIRISVARQGILRELDILLTAESQVKYSIVPVNKPGKLEKRILGKWLGAL